MRRARVITDPMAGEPFFRVMYRPSSVPADMADHEGPWRMDWMIFEKSRFQDAERRAAYITLREVPT